MQDDTRPAPASLVDAWLLGLFPGRSLEEIDQMDMGRLMRAMEAKRLSAAWERHHTPKTNAGLKAHHKRQAAVLARQDRDTVFEMIKIAAQQSLESDPGRG